MHAMYGHAQELRDCVSASEMHPTTLKYFVIHTYIHPCHGKPGVVVVVDLVWSFYHTDPRYQQVSLPTNMGQDLSLAWSSPIRMENQQSPGTVSAFLLLDYKQVRHTWHPKHFGD